MQPELYLHIYSVLFFKKKSQNQNKPPPKQNNNKKQMHASTATRVHVYSYKKELVIQKCNMEFMECLENSQSLSNSI